MTIKELAEALVQRSDEELNEVAKVLREDYGIEAEFKKIDYSAEDRILFVDAKEKGVIQYRAGKANRKYNSLNNVQPC